MAIHIIPDRDASGNVVKKDLAFKSKAVEGGKLFRRKHGFKIVDIPAGQSVTLELNVPYNAVKINEIEFVNCKVGDTVNFKVKDTPTGTISATLVATNFTAIPNLVLNQFGFDAELPDGFYRDVSEYDADLIKDMKIVIEYTNNGTETFTARGNVTYHEVRA